MSELPIPIEEVCERMSVSRKTVHDWAAKKSVRLWQPGGPSGKVFVYLNGGESNDDEFLDAWVEDAH